MSVPSDKSVMESLLSRSGMNWKEFLESKWETHCHHFAFESKTESASPAPTTPTSVLADDLWSQTVRRGWDVLVHMMDTTHPIRCGGEIPGESDPALLFRDGEPLDDPSEIQKLYGRSLYAAYLAGTSIVWNHADLISPAISSLCDDLQKPRGSGGSFPHAYVNVYLTPPRSQTVPAHADDRDVLVFQLVGRKNWKVYQNVPILHPFTHEQVGKSDRAVPESTLRGPLAFDGCLLPGDVLYIPRGMVHEASTHTGSDDLSFHITVALATYDWTLAGNLSRTLRTKLLEHISVSDPKNNPRRSLLPTASCSLEGANLVSSGGSLVDATALQARLNEIFARLSKEITAESILCDMNMRIETHNERASQKRRAISDAVPARKEELFQHPSSADNAMDQVVGPLAAQTLSLETILRASTPVEREYAQKLRRSQEASGLSVRESAGDDVASVVGAIKSTGITPRVGDFRSLTVDPEHSSLCDLTALSLAKRAVELGAFTIIEDGSRGVDSNVAANTETQAKKVHAEVSSVQSPKRQRTHE